jgi:hypothetical protein
MNPFQKVEKIQLPPRRQDTKAHKDLILNELLLVQLSAFMPLWQKKNYSEQTQLLTIG